MYLSLHSTFQLLNNNRFWRFTIASYNFRARTAVLLSLLDDDGSPCELLSPHCSASPLYRVAAIRSNATVYSPALALLLIGLSNVRQVIAVNISVKESHPALRLQVLILVRDTSTRTRCAIFGLWLAFDNFYQRLYSWVWLHGLLQL